MPQIKVLHVLSDLDPGGAQYAVLDIVKHIDRDRFRPHVCCLREGGALVGKLAEQSVPFHLTYFASRLSIIGLLRLRSLIRELGIHVVHTHLRRGNHAGRLAAIWAGAPVVCAHYHDTIPQNRWRQKALTRWLSKRTDKVFCVSGGVRAACLAAGDEIEEKLTVMHNFIEPSEYRDPTDPAAMKAELGFPADCPTVGIVGRLHPFKNHELFLLAARKLVDEDPSIHFAIVGDGQLRKELEQRTHELDLARYVTFTGQRHDMARVYRALDCSVLCSSREGFGKVILEAQAAGVPVVARNVDGVSEVLQSGGGYLMDDATPEAFAVAIDHALQPEARAELRSQAERNLQNFSASRLITELEDVYSELCDQKRAFHHTY